MTNKIKIAITNDAKIMRCRLIIKLVEFYNATPILIPTLLNQKTNLEQHLEKVKNLLKNCNAIIIPGNKRDVHPSLYHQNFIHPQTQKRLPQNPLNARQETEIAMVQHALETQNTPLLGICGGMQIANVTLGGSLNQHLPDDPRIKNNFHHDKNLKNLTKEQKKDFEINFAKILANKKPNIFTGTHEMKVLKDSLLAKIYQKNNPKINLNKITELSIHHQGCFQENLSKHLKISAISPDGVIEAAEHKNYPKMFLLTQFHPECNSSNIALDLVKELINQC